MSTVGGLFSGIGGIETGFEKAGFKILWSNENDPYSVRSFQHNYKHKLYPDNIRKLNFKKIKPVDVLVGGFPCQAFSVAGYRKGFRDPRGNLFFEICRAITELPKMPKAIMLENVKNIRGHDNGKTARVITKSLRELGYSVFWNLFNTSIHTDIPQNRERVWIYAYKGILPLTFKLSPNTKKLKVNFKDLLDKHPDQSLFKNQKQIKRLKELYNLDFMVKEPSCADLYNKNIRKDGISITILEPHHNKMRVVHPPKNKQLKVRKYSVSEHFRFMGFKNEKIDLCNQSYQQLCKMLANGWDINLVALIYENIFNQLENSKTKQISLAS